MKPHKHHTEFGALQVPGKDEMTILNTEQLSTFWLVEFVCLFKVIPSKWKEYLKFFKTWSTW